MWEFAPGLREILRDNVSLEIRLLVPKKKKKKSFNYLP
jgi:hypothetical protein